MFLGRLSGRPLTPISRFTLSQKVHPYFILMITRSNVDRFLIIFGNIAAKKICNPFL